VSQVKLGDVPSVHPGVMSSTRAAEAARSRVNRRSSPQWLRALAAGLIESLASRSLELPVAAAEAIVADRVSAIAATLQISDRAAGSYVDQQALDELADRLAARIADEEPGIDLLAAVCDAALKISWAGQLIAALTQCANFFVGYATVNEELSRYRGSGISDLIFVLGMAQSEHASGGFVFVPRALLFRIARVLESTADLTAKSELRQALQRDAILARTAAETQVVSPLSPTDS